MATVKNADIVQARPAQRPPSAGGLRAAGIVVNHDDALAPNAPGARFGLQLVDIRQRPPAGKRGRLAGKIRRQIDRQGTGDFRPIVRRRARFVQNIEQDDRRFRVEEPCQLLDRDQYLGTSVVHQERPYAVMVAR